MQPPKPSSSRGTSSSRGARRFQAESSPSTSYGIGIGNANANQPSNGTNFHSRRNDEKFNWNNSEQHLNKRAIPSSFQPSGSGSRTNQNPWDHLGNNRGYLSKGSADDAYMYDHNFPRILPHTMARGKPGSSGDYASDPYQNVGFGEERVLGDERLIYQAALQVCVLVP